MTDSIVSNKINILAQLKIGEFTPFAGLNSGKAQTIAAFYWPSNNYLKYDAKHLIQIDPSNQLIITENCPLLTHSSKPKIAILIHGLSGSYQSKYLIRLTRLLTKNNYIVYRMNLRGSSLGKHYATTMYHSGLTSDLEKVLLWAHHKHQTPITIIGFSLGGNLTLKFMGENQRHLLHNKLVDKFIAVSPPLSLKNTILNMQSPSNKIFDTHFTKSLVKDLKAIFQHAPNLAKKYRNIDFDKLTSIYEFDNIFTANEHGYLNADDYYNQCSSINFVNDINHKGLILHALDDPIVSNHGFYDLLNHPSIDTVLTKQGGHLGWLANNPKPYKLWPVRWMDEFIVKWLSF